MPLVLVILVGMSPVMFSFIATYLYMNDINIGSWRINIFQFIPTVFNGFILQNVVVILYDFENKKRLSNIYRLDRVITGYRWFGKYRFISTEYCELLVNGSVDDEMHHIVRWEYFDKERELERKMTYG